MVSKTNVGLKALQCALRTLIFLCALVALAIYAYFLAMLRHHDIAIRTWVRAVEGLAGAAALYSLLGVLLLWCLAGHTVASALALLLDVCFIACFVYIAAANRAGASSCNGSALRTPFGTGAAAAKTVVNQRGATVRIITFRMSCRLESAVLAVSVAACVLLVLAFCTELLLARHHRKEKKFGPGPNNNYTSGSGYRGQRRLGLFGAKKNKNNKNNAAGDGYLVDDPNALPMHAEPSYQVRQSYNTEATAVGGGVGGNGGNVAGIYDTTKPEQGRTYGNFEPVRYDLPQQLDTHPAKGTRMNF